MMLKDVDVERSGDGIAQRILLIEESWLPPRFRIVPGAPLIDGKGDLFWGSYLSITALFCVM